ncbi:MAG: UPF0280 family protein [Candidatus Bathyarchaeia archaeon]
MTRFLFKESFEFKETKGLILSDTIKGILSGLSALKENREKLESYVRRNQKFLHSLTPVRIDEESPKIAKIMAYAAEKAGVGPMAAVAGALADLAVEEMISAGAKIAVVENGGEVSAISDMPIEVGLIAHETPLKRKIGFKLESFPAGVATSSAKFGFTFSLGEADSVTIFANKASIADAAATAVCNAVRGENTDLAINRGIEKALSIEEISGALLIFKGKVAMIGRVPKLINVFDAEEIKWEGHI